MQWPVLGENTSVSWGKEGTYTGERGGRKLHIPEFWPGTFLNFSPPFFSFALITCSLIFWCSQGHGITSFADKAKYFFLAFFPSDSELLHVLPPAALAHHPICCGQCLPAPFPRFSLFNHRPWNAWVFGSCFDGQLMVLAVWRWGGLWQPPALSPPLSAFSGCCLACSVGRRHSVAFTSPVVVFRALEGDEESN